MESAQLEMAVPSSYESTMAVIKPKVATQEMVLSNPGGEPLTWGLETGGLADLTVEPASGILDAQQLAVLTVSFASARTHARAAAYIANITIVAHSGGAS